MITRDEFKARMKCEPVPCEDEDGPIPKLEGLFFKPLDVDDMLAVHDYTEKHGKGGAFRMMFVRAVVNSDGSRVLTDEDADDVHTWLSGPIGAAIPVIRLISGETLGEKKVTTHLTNGKT